MTVLVLGANGLLGSNVVRVARDRDRSIVGTYHTTEPSFDLPLQQCDVRDAASVRELLDEWDVDVVVNCAAVTDVDRCEADPDAALAVNAEAPGDLAALCAETGRTFVHVSTDYVFDGTAERPYAESDDVGPVQTYGRSKLEGERAVRGVAPESLIVRLSFVYGVHRSTGDLSGFPAWVLERFEAGDEVPLFADQHVSPSRAGQSARTILDLLEAGATGTVHVACRSCVTPYEFGALLRRRVDATTELLEEGSMADIDRSAERPAYTCLDVSRVEELLNRPQPTLQKDISEVVEGPGT